MILNFVLKKYIRSVKSEIKKIKMATQGVYWSGTMKYNNSMDMALLFDLNEDEILFIKGQEEISDTGYHHWQFYVVLHKKLSLKGMKRIDAQTRSNKIDNYVWKDETCVDGSKFELGKKPHKQNSKRDWQAVWDLAAAGRVEEIEAGIRINHYRTLNDIATDHEPLFLRPEVRTVVFWGPTGTGKSRRAFDLFKTDYYVKNPLTKWWDGYKGESNIIIDEYDGKSINIINMLKWLDCYPCDVEVKGGARRFKALNFIITSNLNPADWYEDALNQHKMALLRRINVIENMLIKYI
nr:MAG: replication associated protein [Cressdnaviricota sp.]